MKTALKSVNTTVCADKIVGKLSTNFAILIPVSLRLSINQIKQESKCQVVSIWTAKHGCSRNESTRIKSGQTAIT